MGSCYVTTMKTMFHSALGWAMKWVTEGLRDTGELCSTNCDITLGKGKVPKVKRHEELGSPFPVEVGQVGQGAEEEYREHQMLRRACWAASTLGHAMGAWSPGVGSRVKAGR